MAAAEVSIGLVGELEESVDEVAVRLGRLETALAMPLKLGSVAPC